MGKKWHLACITSKCRMLIQENNKGFILPFTLIFLTVILLLTTIAAQLFMTKYKYLENVKETKQREIGELDTIYLAVNGDIEGNGQIVNKFGSVNYKKWEDENGIMTLELSFKRGSIIFPSVNFVYNKQTKRIKEWD